MYQDERGIYYKTKEEAKKKDKLKSKPQQVLGCPSCTTPYEHRISTKNVIVGWCEKCLTATLFPNDSTEHYQLRLPVLPLEDLRNKINSFEIK